MGRWPISVYGTEKKEPCPSVVLGATQNNIAVSLAVYPGQDTLPDDGSNFIVHSCAIANVPIQKWVNLFISVYGRTLDIYIDQINNYNFLQKNLWIISEYTYIGNILKFNIPLDFNLIISKFNLDT